MPRKSLLDRVAESLVSILPTLPSDPRTLKPGDLVRLLNSTPAGEVLTAAKLRGHRDRAGLRIGDGKTIDLFRYGAWLAQEWRQPITSAASQRTVSPETPADAYERKKERERNRNAEASAAGAELGELPKVINPERKKNCRLNFRLFCEQYLPKRFPLAWSDDHLQVIARIEDAVLRGGLFALAMPRGSGKTTLCEAACLWAAIYGHHHFIALVGATQLAANELLGSIKTEIETNPLLAEDFPEVCVPVERLEGSPSRQRKQTHNGNRTRMQWSGYHTIIFPEIEGSPASGVIIKCAGINGRLRGMKHGRADGTQVRPTLAVVDDPQTDKTAKNPKTCKERLKTINGTILRGTGPGETMAGLCPCTVILPGDMAEQLLDRKQNPRWHGEKFKALYNFPDAMEDWLDYRDRRAEELENGGDGSEATAWYAKRRKKMDAGAVVAWKERYEELEISALQHCMNVYFDDPEIFAAEYQNDPIADSNTVEQLVAATIAAKTNGIPRGTVPSWCERLVAYRDVQQDSLWWVVLAVDRQFSAAVVDYGVCPEQKTNHPSKKNLGRTLKDVYPHMGIEARIRAGLDANATELLAKEWPSDGGGHMRIEKMLNDRGFKKNVVDRHCREHVHAPILKSAKGRGIGAKRAPMSLYKKRDGERLGDHWIDKPEGPIRWVDIDTNYWKSFVAERFHTAIGDPGALSLFGRNPHKLFSEHCTAEQFTRVEAEGRVVDEWDLLPHRPDNEWWDCLVGCYVAASMLGIKLEVLTPKAKPKKKRVRAAEYL